MERGTALESIARDGAIVVEILGKGPLDRPIPSCSSWTLERLGDHLGKVYAMATAAIELGTPSEPPPAESRQKRLPGTGAADWVEGRLTALLSLLGSVSHDSACWSFAYGDGTPAFWWRRQVHETLIHRVDAELAVLATPAPGRPGGAVALTPAPAAVAVDGVTEFLEMAGYSEVDWEDLRLGEAATIHLHSTDPEGQAEWTIDCENRQFTQAHLKADVALRGPAFALDRWLWSRGSLDASVPLDLTFEVEVFGDWQAAEEWRPKI